MDIFIKIMLMLDFIVWLVTDIKKNEKIEIIIIDIMLIILLILS